MRKVTLADFGCEKVIRKRTRTPGQYTDFGYGFGRGNGYISSTAPELRSDIPTLLGRSPDIPPEAEKNLETMAYIHPFWNAADPALPPHRVGLRVPDFITHIHGGALAHVGGLASVAHGARRSSLSSHMIS